jgi:hypothetical protein
MALCFAAGSSQYAELPSVYTNLLASLTNVTFTIWFRTTNGNTMPFLWSTKGAGTGKSFVEMNALLGFYFGTNGTFITSTGMTITSDTWTHVALVRSSVTGKGEVWINGVKIYEATLPAQASGTGDLYLGRYDSGLYLSGKLYDFQIHNAVLTKAQIRNIWAGNAVTTNRVARWLMSESSGTTIDDSVGALDGTTFGATWDADAPTFGELDSSGSTAKPQHPMSQQVIG